MYAIGSNIGVMKLSVVNTKFYTTLMYMIARIMAAIAVSVIGGCSLSGGAGLVLRTAVGALIIAVIRNGMNPLNVSTHLQKITIGVIIIVAVLADLLKYRKKV
ncbi:MAG: hypothetical protein ACOYJB_08570 [Christensenellaceae bacterium]